MQGVVNVFSWLSVLVALQFLAPLVAAAQEPEPPTQESPAQESSTREPEASAQESEPATPPKRRAADRWVPSIAVASGIFIQEWDGDQSSQMCTNCTLPNPAAVALRPPASGDDRNVTPYVGGELELMTPELPLPLSPRPFVAGGIVAAFGTDRTVAREGNPGTIETPLAGSDTKWSEDAALGQGSTTEADMDSPVYGARAGIAFPAKLLGRNLRIKPSAGWIHYEVQGRGEVSDAECLTNVPPIPPTNCDPNLPPGGLRSIQLSGSAKQAFDGVGGGLDIEMDTFGFGPLGTSIYIGAHAYKILGNREIEMSDSAQFQDEGPGLPAADTAAEWRVEVDSVMYRLGLGVRLLWLGSD
jgi:hypothetical protein